MYVLPTQEDIDRLPMLYAQRHLIIHHDQVAIGHKDHVDGHACPFFFGRVYGRCRCMIYERRPEVCRAFGEGHGCEGYLLMAEKHGRPLPSGVDHDEIERIAFEPTHLSEDDED